MHRSLRRAVCAALALAVTFVLGACSDSHSLASQLGPGLPPVRANTPTNAVLRLKWAWTSLDTTEYTRLLASDFTFEFSPGDSAGNAFRAVPWTYADEARMAARLFTGREGFPAAVRLAFTDTGALVDQPDPRPGANPRWHRVVYTWLEMNVALRPGPWAVRRQVAGAEVFHLVRGDSAVFAPDHLPATGRDSTLWFVEGWEDQSVLTSAARAERASSAETWGAFRASYR